MKPTILKACKVMMLVYLFFFVLGLPQALFMTEFWLSNWWITLFISILLSSFTCNYVPDIKWVYVFAWIGTILFCSYLIFVMKNNASVEVNRYIEENK